MNEKNYIFGIRAVIEAMKSDKEIDRILVKKGLDNELARELLTPARQLGIPIQYVPPQKLDQITRKNHQGVIAFISEVTYYNIEEIIPKLYEERQNPLILVLDRITDVRNFGAICRSAECAGVHAVIIPTRGAAQVNADAVKTSAGALHKIKVCRHNNLREAVRFLKNSGLQIFAATEKAETLYFDCNYTEPCAIIMGSEEDGISKELMITADQLVKIPILGEIESLNVSAAASVVLFETVRQRVKVTESVKLK
jgi:23S rRNA (guanosine2251-2'-O)-methyltransferase